MAGNPELRHAINKLNLLGLVAVVILVGGVGGWAATTKLSGAVIAPGYLVVESTVKKVQHPTGGIVGEIFIEQGSVVEEGHILIRLDDTVSRANLGIIRAQLDELNARQARLIAERDDAGKIGFPAELLNRTNESSVNEAIVGEQKLFEARRTARTGQRSQLRERIAQINEEIHGLTAQREAKSREIKFIEEELKGVAELYGKKLVSIMRYMTLQRDQARIEGEHGRLVAEIARAHNRIGETELQIIQLDQEFLTEVLKEVRSIEGRTSELKERKIAAEDQLRRIDIRAPQGGVVHDLSVHTVGGVIGAGNTIMLIVPREDKLIVESKVSPSDIDQIARGAPVQVRIMAGNQRITPTVNGVVTNISADLMREQMSATQSAMAFFVVRISISEDSIRKLEDLRLVPGMPAEAYIETDARTPLQYLLKPLQEQIGRTFRER